MVDERFRWEPQPAAQRIIDDLVNAALERCSFARTLSERMLTETATRFIDWVDYVQVSRSDAMVAPIRSAGFERVGPCPGGELWVHPGGLFPKLVLRDDASPALRLGIIVERLDDFLTAHGRSDREMHGGDFAPYRFAEVAADDGAELVAVERHGYQGFDLVHVREDWDEVCARHLEHFRTRPRGGVPEAIAFEEARNRIDDALADLGVGPTCDLFFRAERDYWESRNTAGRVQHERQDRLGLGWANHDHHTFRSSREHFTSAIALFEALGLECREAFHAGADAGWGAQVLESAECGIVVFCDVDMTPDELMGDFAHRGFERPVDALGTVGLWTGLHGESVLQAGMHHLEAQFDWHALVEQLEREHRIMTMAPFTTFPFLRQAFTEGERWVIDPVRIETLERKKLITAEQASTFRSEGAVGSHLENLERNDGFKGFNQAGVSDIIRRTDPRDIAQAG